MNHYCKTSNIALSHVPAESANSAPLSRRRFISFLTAGATSLALQACGGGGASASTSAPSPVATPPSAANPTPVTTPSPVTAAPALAWTTVPDLTFVEGVKSSVSVGQWISGADPTAVVLSLNTVALPAGVTYNSANKTFDYDGIGAATAAGGYVLTAIGG